MDTCSDAHGGKEAVRAWLQQRRAAQLPPPAPADLRHLFNGRTPRAGPPAHGVSEEALAMAGLAIARRGGLCAITITGLAAELCASRTTTYLLARSVATAQLLAATCYELDFNTRVVWRAHEDPPGLARLRRMFESAAQWIAADGVFSPYADPAAITYARLPDKVVAALELGRSRWRSALLGELRAAQGRAELSADCDGPVLLNTLMALLSDIRRDRRDADADALAERACAAMEGLLARHRPAPAAAAAAAAGRSASRPLRPPRDAMPFSWPDWLMAGAPYGKEATPNPIQAR